jgi:uncharacterized protein YegP (UPF0339 family)
VSRPRFTVRPAAGGGYYFTLIAPNGEVIATSEVYADRQGARKGIAAVKRYALLARVLEL